MTGATLRHGPAACASPPLQLQDPQTSPLLLNVTSRALQLACKGDGTRGAALELAQHLIRQRLKSVYFQLSSGRPDKASRGAWLLGRGADRRLAGQQRPAWLHCPTDSIPTRPMPMQEAAALVLLRRLAECGPAPLEELVRAFDFSLAALRTIARHAR